MALYLCLKDDCTSIVTDDNPISTKHTSNGDSKTIAVYIANDGQRKGVPNDINPPALIYTNIQVLIEGVNHKLTNSLSSSESNNQLQLDSVEGWNIGTIIQSGTERMRVDEILTDTSIRVQRNYKADGKLSTLSSHSIGANFVAEVTSVSLALPDKNNPENPGVFLNGGEALTAGIDVTNLVNSVGSSDSDTTIRSNNAAVYSVNSLIKIDNEIMKITNISGNDITVIRGFDGTSRASHSQNADIYCVGLVDKNIAHKFFIKNSPPSGLPTQKKTDIRIVLMADEEPA